MLVDTHAHLQWASFDEDRLKVIERAQKAGVKHVVNIGFDVNSSRQAVELAEKHRDLYATVGIHPHNATQLDRNALHILRELTDNPKVVAIGEIGLDYYRNLSPKDTQKKAFETQLKLAEELELPVVVHNRDAYTDTLKTLSKFKGKIKGIMHCFSGTKEMAEQCINLGFYISFAGPVTFPTAHKLHQTAKWIRLNNMLIETDSPWLAPQNKRGKRNEPAFLPFIAEKIAKLKRISTTELAETTTENAKKIFQLP
jgi:TatD DNase family protein